MHIHVFMKTRFCQWVVPWYVWIIWGVLRLKTMSYFVLCDLLASMFFYNSHEHFNYWPTLLILFCNIDNHFLLILRSLRRSTSYNMPSSLRTNCLWRCCVTEGQTWTSVSGLITTSGCVTLHTVHCPFC